jgi:hypothetical protein
VRSCTRISVQYFFWQDSLSSHLRVWILPSIKRCRALPNIIANDFDGSVENYEVVPLRPVLPVSWPSFWGSAVASENEPTMVPPFAERILGALRTWPSKIALLTVFDKFVLLC